MTGRAAPDEPAGSAGAVEPAASLLAAVAAVDALREGDAWYAAQTHATLARYALEEGHEVAAAAEAVDGAVPGDGTTAATDGSAGLAATAALRDELGDLLLQVVLHARLAAEREDGFDLADVAASLVDKARRRHPHVFAVDAAGEPTVAELEAGWEALKDADRAGRDPLDDLPASLPALVRAQKVLALAERAGLPAAAPPEAAAASVAVGPALLALVDAARRAGMDAEQELRTTVQALEDAVRAAPPPQR